jgi:transcription elongation factor Elf1
VILSGETDWQAHVQRQKEELFKTRDDALTVEIACPVCGSQPSDGSSVRAQVLLEDAPLYENRLVPEAFNCFVCGLEISPGERFLARHFVGDLLDDVAAAYREDIGHA